MFSSRLASFAIITTLVASALADFQITNPGTNNWWGKYPVEAFLHSSPSLMHYVPKLLVPRTFFRGLAKTTPLLPQMDNTCSCGCCFLSFLFLLVGMFSPTLCRSQVKQHQPQILSGAGRSSRKYSQCRLLRSHQRRASGRYSRRDGIYRSAHRYG
jgi:hypothetical protein